MKSKLTLGFATLLVILVACFLKYSSSSMAGKSIALVEQKDVVKKKEAIPILTTTKADKSAQKKVDAEENEKIFEVESEDDKDKYDGPALAAKFDYDRMIDPALGTVPAQRLLTALDQTMLNRNIVMYNQTVTSLPLMPAPTWTERGPNSDATGPSNGNTRANNGIASGRVRAIWVDLNDTSNKTVFIGGVDGGLWKTSDITSSPATWTVVNDYLSNLAISAICQDPRPGYTNIMYFCTGESYYNGDAVQGNGVFKSIDGGVTWSYLTSTSGFPNSTRILCDYLGNVYLATRGTGLRRSTNGGTTWSSDLTPSSLPSDICDMEISSTTAAGRLHIVTGIFSTQAYRYTDVPTTVSATIGWNAPVTAFPSYTMRAEIACSNQGAGLASTCTLYALPANSSYQVPTIYKSTDGGANWAACTSTNLGANWASGQGWYALSMDINPSDPTQVIIGGLDTWKSTNSGSSWTQISTWVGNSPVNEYVHADVHKILWFNNGNKLLFGSDGGVFYSNNGGSTISDRNAGLRIKQFYSCAIHPSTTNYFLAGAQDNGVHQFSAAGLSSSVEVTGGDGAFVAIDQQQPQYQFGSYVYNQYRRSTNSGVGWSSITLSSSTGQFINPIDYDNTNKIMYCGDVSGSYRRWTNPQSGSTSAVVSVSNLAGSVTSVTVSPYTSNRVYLGTSSGKVVQVDNANTFTSGSAGTDRSTGLASGTVSCVNEGTSDNYLIAVFSNYGINNVWVSTNGGTSWTGCDGNLPDMPVRWAMFFPGDNNKAYIATETGVWQTDNLNGASTVWSSNATFPSVRTDMIKYRTSDRVIAAATHGRGLFTAAVPLLCDIVINTPTVTQPTCAAPAGTIVNSATSVNTLEYSIDNGTTWQSAAAFNSVAAGNYNIQVRLQGEPTCYASYASNPVTINAAPLITPSVSIGASTNNVCSGTSITITATPTNGGSTPTYNFKVNGNSVQNGSSNTYTSTSFTNGQSVTCAMSSSDICANPTTATSGAITMNISNTVTPSVSIAASTNNVCTGTSVTITATPTNGGSAPTYNFKVNSSSVQNGSTATYTPASFNNNDVVTCVMTANSTCQTTATATSSALTIGVKPTSTNTITTSICAGSSYTVGSSSYNTTGTFVTHLTNYVGCDSAVTLNLTVKPTSTKTITTSICAGSSYTVGSSSYNTTGTFVTHLTNYVGCDSAVTLNLTVKPTSTNTITTSICAGSSYTVGSSSYNTTGTFVAHLTNYVGCDSAVTLHLTVVSSLTASVALSPSTNNICYGTSVTITANPTNGGTSPTYNFKVNGASVQNSSSNVYASATFNNNDTITCVMTANNTCQTSATANSNAVIIHIASPVTPSVSISASTNNVCAGTSVTFTAAPTNGGSLPTYQWTKGGVNISGATNATYTYAPLNADVIACVMTANNTCQTLNQVGSGNITMTVTSCGGGGSGTPPANDNPCGSISGSQNTGSINPSTPNYLVAYDNGATVYGGIADNPTGISGSAIGLTPSGPNLIYWSGTTASASSYSNEPMPPGVTNPGGNTQRSIWYKFHAPTMADATVYLRANYQASATWNASTHQTQWIIALYKLAGGSACSSPTFSPVLAAGNPVYSTNGSVSITGNDLSTQGLLGQDIYVQLMLPNGASGTYQLSLQGIMPDIGPGASNQFTTTSLPISLSSPLNNVNTTYLYWRPVGGSGYAYTNIGSSPSNYTLNGLNSGVNYNIWALYVNTGGSRLYSRMTAPIGTTTGCSGLQPAPTVSHVTGHCSKVNISFTPSVAPSVIPASYPYRLYWSKTGSGGYGVVAIQNSNYQLTSLALNQSYDYFYRVICTGGAQVVSSVTTDITCSGPSRLAKPTAAHSVYEVNGTYFIDADIREVIAAYEAAHPDMLINDGKEHTFALHQVNMPNVGDEPSTTTSLNESLVANTGSFSVVPNPANHQVAIHYQLPENSSVATISLLDITGKVVQMQTIEHPETEGTARFDVNQLQAGIYLVNVKTEGYIETKRLVVSK